MLGSKNIKHCLYLQRIRDYSCKTKTDSTTAYTAVEAQISILEAPKSRVVKPNREMALVKTPSWAFDSFLPFSGAVESPKAFKPHIPAARRPTSKPPIRNVTAAMTLVSETNRYPSLFLFCTSSVSPIDQIIQMKIFGTHLKYPSHFSPCK
jgi:hypothetical protein